MSRWAPRQGWAGAGDVLLVVVVTALQVTGPRSGSPGQVPDLLAKRTASGYEEAVAHLVELRDLAVHRKQRAGFDARLRQVIAPYATSAALQRRLRENIFRCRWKIG